MPAEKLVWLRMSYRCCGMEWTDDWPAALRLECPECGEIVDPIDVVEVRPRRETVRETSRARAPQIAGSN